MASPLAPQHSFRLPLVAAVCVPGLLVAVFGWYFTAHCSLILCDWCMSCVPHRCELTSILVPAVSMGGEADAQQYRLMGKCWRGVHRYIERGCELAALHCTARCSNSWCGVRCVYDPDGQLRPPGRVLKGKKALKHKQGVLKTPDMVLPLLHQVSDYGGDISDLRIGTGFSPVPFLQALHRLNSQVSVACDAC